MVKISHNNYITHLLYTQVRTRNNVFYSIIISNNLLWVIYMSAVKNAVVQRIRNICRERGMAVNELANLSGMTPSTLYSLLDDRRKNASITTIKIICDGLDMTLGEFFSSQEFDELEQEIE